ncbi:MAG TPA: hypothetical protein VGO21_01055, partial [Candidatus Paceibacterota bacterium]|nr:hypothetical protein [Candidatus Paceibacterota bacterium]
NMNNTFKPDSNIAKSKENRKEYYFNEGVAESVSRIKKLFISLDRHVYVIICGSGSNVGKTALLSSLQRELGRLAIPTEHEWTEGQAVPQTKTVRFTTQVNDLWTTGAKLRNHLIQSNPALKFGDYDNLADLYIGIYSSDKKFLEPPEVPEVADLVICNELAKDNPI